MARSLLRQQTIRMIYAAPSGAQGGIKLWHGLAQYP